MSHYIFSLPPDLLEHITLRTQFALPPREPSPAPTPLPLLKTAISSTSKSCNICLAATFANVDDQRVHFRSDWHRYNVKLRLRGEDVVGEQQFFTLVENLEDSISGSASSSEDESSDTPDAVQALLAKSNLRDRSPSPTSEDRRPRRGPIIWFHSPPSTQIGVYNTLFPLNLQQDDYVRSLKQMQHGGLNGRIWTMLMVAGGHFAGIVVQVRRPDEDKYDEDPVNKKKKKQKAKPEIEVLKHKTFHRYTTRRKQGGSQSMNDNAKGPAKSAGAQLRRYGEQALREDIRNLMADWVDDIAASELIWIRASVSNKRIFYDYDEAAFTKGDERLRTFPFPTRRPTQSELLRCLNELTHVKVSHFTEENLREQDEAYLASLPKPKPVPAPVKATPLKPAVVKLSKEEEIRREKWSRLEDMAIRGRVEAFKDLWQREGESLGGINTPLAERDLTLLHICARAGQEEMTQFLLEELHADPTLPIGETDHAEDDAAMSDASDAPPPVPTGLSRVAYDLARSKGVRNVFRRCAWAHPEWWDWLGAARIPSVLNPKMEEEREERRKSRRKGLKEKIRERQTNQERFPLPPEPVHEITPSVIVRKAADKDGPRRLGGSTAGEESLAGLNADMRAKIERERRARAAEARLKALGQSR